MTTLDVPEPDRRVMAQRDELVGELVRLCGSDRVVADELGREVFGADAYSARSQPPLAAVFPVSTREVSRVLRFCYEQGVGVVPRGGGTSLCGGAAPAADNIVLCLSRMNKVVQIDEGNRLVRVEAGTPNASINRALSGTGFSYAPDPLSRATSTIGGNIATNACGPRSLFHGATSAHVLGLECVLLDGEVVQLGSGELDPSGPDLLGLMLGAEGQIGVVTEATLRIVPSPEQSAVLLFGFGSLEAACACALASLGAGDVPVSVELLDRQSSELYGIASGAASASVEAILIIEIAGSPDELKQWLALLEQSAQAFAPLFVHSGDDELRRNRSWDQRGGTLGAAGRIADYLCVDCAVPVIRLADTLAGIGEICRTHRVGAARMAQAAEGTLQVLVFYDAGDQRQLAGAERAGAEIMTYCVRQGGVLSSAHGIGLQKRDMMETQLSEGDLELQALVKSSFDPERLLNPGKVLPLDAQMA